MGRGCLFHLRGDLESKLFIRTFFIVRSAVLSVHHHFAGKWKLCLWLSGHQISCCDRQQLRSGVSLRVNFTFFCFKDLKSQQVISLSEFFLSFHISSFLAIFIGDMWTNSLVDIMWGQKNIHKMSLQILIKTQK